MNAFHEVLLSAEESISRAAGRMQRSQHRDGGWGPFVERSALWQSAFTVLFLKTYQDLPRLQRSRDVASMLQHGIAYLDQHHELWSVDQLSSIQAISLYDVSLMSRCFYRVGRSYFRRESALRVYRGIDRISRSQNLDGGWDARLWGYEVSTPTQVWSEVGATAFAIQALVEAREERFRSGVEKGVHWLAAAQNPDGSWSSGCSHPMLPAYQLSGGPSVSKTCDALQGLLYAPSLGVDLQPYRQTIARAVGWLTHQIEPVLTCRDRFTGPGYCAEDYEQVCLVLETMLLLREPSLALLAASVGWLVISQHRSAGDVEDGSWVLGDTARIGLALAVFSRRFQDLL